LSEKGSLYRLSEGVWKRISLPMQTQELLQHRSQNFEIVKYNQGYAARFCGWDNGLDWYIANNPLQNKIYFFDKNFNLTAEHSSNSYNYKLGSSGDRIWIQSDKMMETSDGITVSESEGNHSFPENNGIFTLIRRGNITSVLEQGTEYPIAYESGKTPREIKATGGLFYSKKSWKTYFSDLETENILSVSADGLHWTDFTLPNTFLELKKVLYLNGKIYIDGRFQTIVLEYQPKQNLRMILNGTVPTYEIYSEMQEDDIFVSAQSFFRQTGLDVTWSAKNETLTISGNQHTILLQVGENTAQADEKQIQLNTPVYLNQHGTMIPLRFLIENLGYEYSFDKDRQLIIIDTK